MNKKDTGIILLLFFVMLSSAGFAQVRYSKADTLRDPRGNIKGFSSVEFQVTENSSTQERIEYFQIKKSNFFSNYIGFTIKESQLFWPIYNEYMDRQGAIYEKRRNLLKILTSSQLMAMDEKAVKKNLDDYMQYESEQSALKMEYHKKFSEVLSPLKMVRLYLAEEEFQKSLFRELRGR